MKKSIKITKQENLLASNGTGYLIPYLDGQQYLASDTNVVYEDVGGKRMAITEVRFSDIGNNSLREENTDWVNFLTIIKSGEESNSIYKLYYYDLDGKKIPISIESGTLDLESQTGDGLVWNENKINIKINENDFEFTDDNSLTLKEKANNYPVIIDPDNWILEEGKNYFYIDWPLAGLKTIDTIIVDGLSSYFWDLGLEAKIIENGIKFSIPKQFGSVQNSEPGKPLSSLVLNVTVIKAQTTSIVDDIPIVPIEGQQIITGILTGAVDKFDTVYSEVIRESNWDTAHKKLSSPADLPAGNSLGVAFSSDNTYIAVAHYTSPFITVYKRSGDTFTKLTGIVTPPPGITWSVTFSSDDTYLAVGHEPAPYLTVYKRSGDVFTKITGIEAPPDIGMGIAFSSDDTYMAVAHFGDPYITVYKRSEDTFTKLSGIEALVSDGRSVAFSSDDTYMAVAHYESPFITVYKRSGDLFTKLSGITAPAGDGKGIAFSSDDTYMAVSQDVEPYLTVYKHSGDTFTKLSGIEGLDNVGWDVAFSSDNTYMAAAHAHGPRITVYKRSGDIFTKLPGIEALPRTALDVAFSSNGIYLAVAHYDAPYLTIYKTTLSYPTTLISPAFNEIPLEYEDFGYALESGVADDEIDMVSVFRSTPVRGYTLTVSLTSADQYTTLTVEHVGGTQTTYPYSTTSIADVTRIISINHSDGGGSFIVNDLYVSLPYTLTQDSTLIGSFSSLTGDLTVEGQQIITGILTGTVDQFDNVYSESISGGSNWDTVHNKLSNPEDLPTGNGQAVTFSSDETYLAVAHYTSPFLTVYKRSGDTFTKIPNIEEPAGSGYGVSFSGDGTYLAIIHSTSPYLTVYKRSGDNFTKLSGIQALTSGGNSVSFSSDGIYLGVAHYQSPYITVYKRSGDAFSRILVLSPEVLNYHGISFSSDGTYFAVAHTYSQSYSVSALTVFKRSEAAGGGEYFNEDIHFHTGGGAGRDVAFSNDDNYLALTHNSTPYLTVYKRSGDKFTKITGIEALPGTGYDISFSSDSTYLSVAHSYSPYLTVYKRSGDAFTKLSGIPEALPEYINSVSFSNNDTYLAVAHQTSPFLTIYKTTVFNPTALISPTFNVVPLSYHNLGYALESGVADDKIDMVSISRSTPVRGYTLTVSLTSDYGSSVTVEHVGGAQRTYLESTTSIIDVTKIISINSSESGSFTVNGLEVSLPYTLTQDSALDGSFSVRGYTLTVSLASNYGSSVIVEYIDGTQTTYLESTTSIADVTKIISINHSDSSGSFTVNGLGVSLPYTLTQDSALVGAFSCLTGDMLITMADKTTKRLDEIEVDDEILSYDWNTMKLVPNKVIFTDKDENKSFIEYHKWTFDDDTIIKTVHKHEFYNVEEKQFKYMDMWSIGEHAYKQDGTMPMLVSHELITEDVRHYKITGELGTNYFVNGLLNGDRNCPKHIELGGNNK